MEVSPYNQLLKSNGTPDNQVVTAVKWNLQGNYIVITHSDITAADIIPFTEGIANVIIPGATGTIREDKKWFKIEVNNVRTGAQDSNGKDIYSPEFIYKNLQYSNPEYMAITQHIVLKPRWVHPASELSQQDYSSVVFAVDSQEIHQTFLTNHKTLLIFGVIAKT